MNLVQSSYNHCVYVYSIYFCTKLSVTRHRRRDKETVASIVLNKRSVLTSTYVGTQQSSIVSDKCSAYYYQFVLLFMLCRKVFKFRELLK